MKQLRTLGKMAACMVVVTALSACGGGGGGGGSTATTPASSLAGPAGKAVQGPVKGATVFADNLAGGNRMVQDASELFAVTDVNGSFQLPTKPAYSHVLVSAGGIDILTNQPAIRMIAPAGSANVTPLTTLVALDTTGTVQAKIEAILPAGARFDTDLSSICSPAAILLVKAVETAVQAVSTAIGTDASDKISPAQLAAIQAEVAASIAAEIAKPDMTALRLGTPNTIASTTSMAVSSALANIAAAPGNANIAITPAAAAAAEQAVFDSIITTSIALVGSANLTKPASTSAVSGGEAALVTPTVATAIVAATTSATATIAADPGLVTAATPPVYNPPPVAMVAAPSVTASLPDNGVTVAGGTRPVLSVTFTADMLAAVGDAGSAVNPVNWVVKAGTTTIGLGAITYNGATRTFSTMPAAGLPSGTTVTVTIKRGVKSAAGVGMINDVTWSFLTSVTGTTGSSGGGGI